MNQNFLRARVKPRLSRAWRIPALIASACLLILAIQVLIAVHSFSLGSIAFVAAASEQSAPQPVNKGQNTHTGSSVEGCAACETKINDARKDLESRIDADRKNSEDKINQELDRSKQLLDWIMALAGLYSVIAALTAYMSVKYARDEAKDQIDIFRKKIEDIEQEYQRNFPEFTGMDGRLQRLLRTMELHMPSMDEWNDDDAFSKLSEVDRQYILDSEITVSAISVFGLDRSTSLRTLLSSIYSIFARFYASRNNSSPNPNESDFVRALSYAKRVIEVSPGSSEGYRQRGAIYLGCYQRLLKVAGPADADRLEEFLKSAELDLAEAISKCTDDKVDAGAFYNQALADYYRGRVEMSVSVSRRLLALRGKIPHLDRERYLPYVYQNLSCFLAKLAAKVAAKNQAGAVKQFSNESVQTVAAGIEDFKKTETEDGGLARLRTAIAGELRQGGDLSTLEQSYRDKIEELIRDDAGGKAQNPPAPAP